MKAEIMVAVSEWIDRALDGETELLTIAVVDHRGDEVVFNMVEGDFEADDPGEPSQGPAN